MSMWVRKRGAEKIVSGCVYMSKRARGVALFRAG
jgi:hypothetical protein